MNKWRRLSDKTLARYEILEHEGKLTKRQRNALAGHRRLTRHVRTYVLTKAGKALKRKQEERDR